MEDGPRIDQLLSGIFQGRETALFACFCLLKLSYLAVEVILGLELHAAGKAFRDRQTDRRSAYSWRCLDCTRRKSDQASRSFSAAWDPTLQA
jgi:hypothetical protein